MIRQLTGQYEEILIQGRPKGSPNSTVTKEIVPNWCKTCVQNNPRQFLQNSVLLDQTNFKQNGKDQAKANKCYEAARVLHAQLSPR
jgi:hypothetical protein